VAYGARLEIVLGVKTLAGSNPASSATYQQQTPGAMIDRWSALLRLVSVSVSGRFGRARVV
jgi:hypothetical protein